MEKAISEYEQALSIDPYSPDIYFSRGLVFLRSGDYDDAIADYDQAITLSGEANSYFNRGTAYLLSGRIGQGLIDYMEGIRIKGNETTVEQVN